MKKSLFAATAIASVLLFGGIANAQSAEFRLCTGKETGNYIKAGHIMKRYIPSIEVVSTEGSVENLQRLSDGQCDGAFVQSDSFITYADRYASVISGVKRVGTLYKEYVHLLCNKNAGIDHITDLTDKHTIAIGSDGTGSSVTWNAFVLASKAGWFKDKKYNSVKTVNDNGYAELTAANETNSVSVVGEENIHCILSVSSFGSGFIKNDAAEFPNLALVSTDDKDMGTVKDKNGNEIYLFETIPAKTYPASMPSGWLGNKSVETIGVQAIFIVSTKWIAENKKSYETLLRTFTKSKKDIASLVGQ